MGLAEVFERHGSVNLDQPTQSPLLNVRVQLSSSPALEKALSLPIPEALDHAPK